MAGVFFWFECAVCGDEAHPNPPPAFRMYCHKREYARWKGGRVPPGGWKEYDHKPELKRQESA